MASTDCNDERSVLSAMGLVVGSECGASPGNLLGVGVGCLFGASMLKFWLINGLIDFSSALVLGTVASPSGLLVRLAAYVLVVPFFIGVRLVYLVSHPRHRTALGKGRCPDAGLFSLDWFTVGILATGLPIALRDLGPWLGMNAVFLLGLFVLPRFVGDDSRRTKVKLGALVLGSVLFVYANYGKAMATATPLPAPTTILGPVATLQLPASLADMLFAVFNSLLLGPAVVAVFALLMNFLLTHPVLRDIPYVRHTLPRRDPARIVVASAVVGTLFYLAVVAAATGQVQLLP